MTEYVMLASLGSDLAQMAGETATKFGWNLPGFLSQVISFCIVAFLLHRFAYKPILQALEDRRRTIAESLDNAEKIKQELANTEAARKEVLAQANDQAVKLIEEARVAAAKVLEQETQKAIAAAGHIQAKAREAADAELARMKGELRKEFGRLVVQAAARSTGDILSPDQKTRLADDAVRQLAE